MTALSEKLLALIGPLLVLAAILVVLPNIQARRDFADAPRVRATVLTAEYDARETATVITLAAPDAVPLDDLRTAPDGLAPGDTVTALVRPGHALLPEQLRRSSLVLPVLFAGAGCAATVVGLLALRADPPRLPGRPRRPRLPTGPTDPEAWF
ncbi:hypothetical protein ACFV1L_10805 [Kitasatospora sp. NPDC059646]|uniref:hypothetical protein n=1 Tax=Kitasatospora sp. NPDC059646 TaxID=3346893 RepID=UPI003683F4B8